MKQNRPLFSICIPQYNRTQFLIRCIESIAAQTFRDVEVCISDGGSTDGGFNEIDGCLRGSGLEYTFVRSDENMPYDRNLRCAISLSRGQYVFLMGNDDELSDESVLQFIAVQLGRYTDVVSVVTNYCELSTHTIYRRMRKFGVVGSGPACAALTFRHYAFVSGIVFNGPMARMAATDSVDGSEMYQMYVGTHLVASGGAFLGIDRVCINKDIQIPGQVVDSYRSRQKENGWPIRTRPLPLGRILHTVWIGAEAGAGAAASRQVAAKVSHQLYLYTYPFWIFEYRRVQSFGYAVGVYLALRPSEAGRAVPLALSDRIVNWSLYVINGVIASMLPLRLFDFIRPLLYCLAKRA